MFNNGDQIGDAAWAILRKTKTSATALATCCGDIRMRFSIGATSTSQWNEVRARCLWSHTGGGTCRVSKEIPHRASKTALASMRRAVSPANSGY